MRISEWIQAGFATILAVAAWIAPLEWRRRLAVTELAVIAIVGVVLARLSEYVIGPVAASILRDWLPVPLLLIPYWQTGQFFTGPDEKIQARLVASDRWLWKLVARGGWSFGRWAKLSMEWAYALCYGLATFGLVVLYAAGLRSDADRYWFFALVPTYLCYAMTPFVPALPPRSLGEAKTPARASKSRIFNLWILKYGSIQAISFPSAHVASGLGISLVLLHDVPIAGAIFLAITVWIGVAAVVGGYHYVIDVVLGAIVTLIVYAAWRGHLIPNTLLTAPASALLALL